jgi:AraC-like DNA-binding protein
MAPSNRKPKTENRKLAVAAPGPWVRTSEPLLWLNGAGHEIRTSRREYFFDSRKRPDDPHVVLQLTISGSGYYERGGKGVLLPAGAAFLDVIPGNFRYGYPPAGSEPYEQVFVGLAGRVARRWCSRIVGEFGHVLHFGASNALEPLMLSIARQHVDRALGDRYLVSARLYQLLMTVYSALNQSRVATAPLVSQAVSTIEERAADPSFNVTTLARELSCSREHITRLFQSSVNVSPLDYLTQHRLRLVAGELRARRGKLEHIAQRCGFSGANYLCRVFRRQYGVTPAQARARPWLLA